MQIQIRHRYTSAVLFEGEFETLAKALEEAVRKRANLAGASLAGANLAGASLAGANLEGASLEGANLGRASLEGANLAGASLAGANLEGASLEGANLGRASLEGASLEGASLEGANLGRASLEGASLAGASLAGANLGRASLEGASLEGANLATQRADLRVVLDAAPREVAGLLAALKEGRVDGSVYEGECACLVGTIAKVRGCNYRDLGIRPDSGRPAEQWFMLIRPGHTPEKSAVTRLTVQWVEEWQRERGALMRVVETARRTEHPEIIAALKEYDAATGEVR